MYIQAIRAPEEQRCKGSLRIDIKRRLTTHLLSSYTWPGMIFVGGSCLVMCSALSTLCGSHSRLKSVMYDLPDFLGGSRQGERMLLTCKGTKSGFSMILQRRWTFAADISSHTGRKNQRTSSEDTVATANVSTNTL